MHRLLIGLAAAACAAPAAAEVTAVDEGGFVTHHEIGVPAAPDAAWAAFAQPGTWWNGEHSYSRNAANMTLTQGFIGTPSYGSPEQAMNRQDIDGRADFTSAAMPSDFSAASLIWLSSRTTNLRRVSAQASTRTMFALPPSAAM